ncbi:hypothetical protein KH5H1_56070 [Corallococcus caeni]|uniref:SprT-like domain-containing protein n=1 Tax=Corallococcus caeni TaxID=3082388 RepID=A0ABQ6QQY3_9BACT|nr:hypothetical protein KH5H1_56070 [Corallococcus sp. KH5-1]GMU06432.1 hypothetical protein ASNO1_26850 [Corallococcus sp. NO1]
MPKAVCGGCGELAILSNNLCRACRDRQPNAVPKKEEERPGFAQQERHAQSWGDDLETSLEFTKASKMPAMYISTMSPANRGFGTVRPEDMAWANVVAEVFANNFLHANPLDFVFRGLVLFGSDEMIFSPPGQSSFGAKVPSPSISVIPFHLFQKKIENASLADWVCVMCHEIIHYLHWRWRLLPCLEKERNAYEDAVTGTVKLATCGIPLATEKEAAGKRELVAPPADFTENGFRARYGLAPRKVYGDCTNFGGPGGAQMDKHPLLRKMYPPPKGKE